MEEYDFVIVGGGAAAFAAAIQASQRGARTAMIERGTLGGTCVNVGCVPSKLLITAADTYYYGHHSPFPGVSGDGELDLPALVRHKDGVVAGLRERKYIKVLEGLDKVELIEGQAAFDSPNIVAVNGRRLRAPKFLVATGSSPHVPDIPGLEQAGYLTNVEALSPTALPERLVVIGGRALGLEFAQLYAHLGSHVTVLQRSARLLPEEEPEVSDSMAQYLREEGLHVLTGATPKHVEIRGGDKVVHASVGGQSREFPADAILMGTGRRPNTADLHLDAAGVTLGASGEAAVNEEMRTSAAHVFAAGDVTGRPMLETVAAKEGYVAAMNALTDQRKTMDFSAVPHAVFTNPQVASVGLTEEAMMRKYQVCVCRTVSMKSVPKAEVVGDTRGLVKLVIHPETRKILGVHIVAPLAADMIHEGVLAVKFGLTIDDLIDTVHVFPTYSEAIKLAAMAFYADVDSLSCCAM